MAISKLVGRKVKVSIAFVQDGEKLCRGYLGAVTEVSQADGMTFVTIDWSTSEVKGWGISGSMWNVSAYKVNLLSYLNNKPVKL